MVNRKCPNCGTVWYSADSGSDWVCYRCGGVISKVLNTVAKTIK